MGVDKSYGSGTKKATAAKPAAPRARRARGSAKPNTPLSQMSKAQWNASVVQGQGARRRANGDFSSNALDFATGFNSRDGVDAGYIAGLVGSAVAYGPSSIGKAIAKVSSRVARAVAPKVMSRAIPSSRAMASAVRNSGPMSATRPSAVFRGEITASSRKSLEKFKDLDVLNGPKLNKSTLNKMQEAINYRNKVGR